jgi:hypothetical protein
MSLFGNILGKTAGFFKPKPVVDERDPMALRMKGIDTTSTGAMYPSGRSKSKPSLATTAVFGPAANPVSSFVNQLRYGMNEQAANEYNRLAAENKGFMDMSEAERVQLARKPQMDAQLPNAVSRPSRNNSNRGNVVSNQEVVPMPQVTYPQVGTSEGFTGMFQGALPDVPQITPTFAPEIGAAPQLTDGLFQGELPEVTGITPTYAPEIGPVQDAGTFRPVTVTSSASQAAFSPEGVTTGLTGSAADLQQQAATGATGFGQRQQSLFDQDVADRAQEIYNRQLALLEPQERMRRAAMEESQAAAGTGDLRFTPETLGLEGDDLVNKGRYEDFLASKTARAQLAAAADQQAMAERAQEIALTQSAQQGMFNQFGQLAGLEAQGIAPALQAAQMRQEFGLQEQQLPYQLAAQAANIDASRLAQAQSQQQLPFELAAMASQIDANQLAQMTQQQRLPYELAAQAAGIDQTKLGMLSQQQQLPYQLAQAQLALDLGQQEIAQGGQMFPAQLDQMLANIDLTKAQAENARYQPSSLSTGLLGLGTSFLGTSAGSNWLTNLFGRV